MERMPEMELTKRSEAIGVAPRGRPSMKWTGMVEKYLRERRGGRATAIDNVKQICLDRDVWRGICRGHHVEDRYII